MEQFDQGNGPHPKMLQGSTLIIALTLISIMSLLSLFLLQTYRSVAEFSFRTKHYYQARIMTDLFLLEYPTLVSAEQKGIVKYNHGQVAYEQEATQLKIKTTVGKYSWTVYEKITKNESENNTETESNVEQ
jgi:hypothetical protein